MQKSTPFRDPKFVPDKNWKAPHEFLNKNEIQLFKEFSQYSIIQGSLGDCYLMGSLIVLSENPQNIKKLFINDYNEFGLYGIWICESGAWRLIILDHFIPCGENSGPCYARTKHNELWVMLLEKAYAKTYKGYKKIILGFAGDALKDLTGAPSEYIDLEDEKTSWVRLMEAKKNNFVLCASTKTKDELESNLISKHNYAILAVKEVNKKEFWLKLQNPLQNFSWKSSCKMTPEVEKSLEINQNDDKNGIFWINFHDFRQNFEVVTCNKIHSDYFYSYLQNRSPFSLVKAVILEKSHCYFSIHQTHERYFKETGEKYFYPLSRIIICRLENDIINNVINGNFSTKQTTFTEVWLEPGEYLIYAEVDAHVKSFDKMTISAYSSLPIVMDLIPDSILLAKKIDILEEMFKCYILKGKNNEKVTKYDAENILKFNGTLWGFVYFFYVNNSENTNLYEAMTLTKCENLTFFYPFDHKNNTYFEISCKPKEHKLVLYKIGFMNNGSHACSMNSMVNLSENFNDQILIQKALKEGAASKRNNQVSFMNYKFKGGNAFVYQNKGNVVYQEKLTFKTLENIEVILENDKEVKGRDVNVKVEPNGGVFLLRLNIKNPFVKKSGFNYTFI